MDAFTYPPAATPSSPPASAAEPLAYRSGVPQVLASGFGASAGTVKGNRTTEDTDRAKNWYVLADGDAVPLSDPAAGFGAVDQAEQAQEKFFRRYGLTPTLGDKVTGVDGIRGLRSEGDVKDETLARRIRGQEVTLGLPLAVKAAPSPQGKAAGLDLKAAGRAGGPEKAKKAVELAKIEELRPEVEKLAELPAEPDLPASRPQPSTNAPIPQPEVQTSDNTFSTFSLNVSDVAFKLAGASLENGAWPDPATIRSEEFINAFNYRDPEPPPGVPVAFTCEQARYPFAQNRDLLRFSIKTASRGRQPGRPLNLVLLLDSSGSMERADRVAILREALRVLGAQLQPQDRLSIVTFSRTARLLADGVSGAGAKAALEEASSLAPEGGTNLEEALNLAYQTALRHASAQAINRVVLLTDGAANLGDVEPETLRKSVEARRREGIALDCFGIGWEGLNDDLLEALSRNGDGRYGFLNSPGEASAEFAGQLAGALRVAASDVKVQVEFNPQRVTAYRQIGYAKHQLKKEQFRDNTVDAAEIGAAEAGTALYVVEVNPAGTGPLATVRVRYRVPGTPDYREQAWPVLYTGSAVALHAAPPAMRLAAAAAAFSEWLAASPYAAEVTPDALLHLLAGVPEVYGNEGAPKKLEGMIRQAASLAGNR